MPKSAVQPSHIRREALNELLAVSTIAEASQRWKKSTGAIVKAIDKGQLVSRRSGATYLISNTSLCARWGDPVEPITDIGVY